MEELQLKLNEKLQRLTLDQELDEFLSRRRHWLVESLSDLEDEKTKMAELQQQMAMMNQQLLQLQEQEQQLQEQIILADQHLQMLLEQKTSIDHEIQQLRQMNPTDQQVQQILCCQQYEYFLDKDLRHLQQQKPLIEEQLRQQIPQIQRMNDQTLQQLQQLQQQIRESEDEQTALLNEQKELMEFIIEYEEY